MSEPLARGRERFEERQWADAFAVLTAADRRNPLAPDDLERLAAAAYLVGRDEESVKLWERAHRELLRRGGPSGEPNPFAMASEAQTRALLERAGFTAVRTEEVPVHFSFRDIDDYFTFTADTGGAVAPVLRGMADGEREALKAQLGAAFAPFRAEHGYELGGIALNAVAR